MGHVGRAASGFERGQQLGVGRGATAQVGHFDLNVGVTLLEQRGSFLEVGHPAPHLERDLAALGRELGQRGFFEGLGAGEGTDEHGEGDEFLHGDSWKEKETFEGSWSKVLEHGTGVKGSSCLYVYFTLA